MPDLSNKKALFIIAPKKFRDEEFFEPKKILESKGVSITVASRHLGIVEGMLGARVKVDVELSEVKVRNFDVIVFVGGSGAQHYFNDHLVLNLAKEAVSLGKIVGAICIAPSILANAKVLQNKKATAFATETNNLRKHKAVVVALPVVKDGKIITAQGPHAAKAFGQEIVKTLTFS